MIISDFKHQASEIKYDTGWKGRLRNETGEEKNKTDEKSLKTRF